MKYEINYIYIHHEYNVIDIYIYIVMYFFLLVMLH